MTDQTPPPPSAPDPYAAAPPPPAYAAPPASVPPPASAYGAPVAMTGPGPVGKVRSTGLCILLAVVTLGIYEFVWYYKVHSEMKRHTGSGIGGGVALVLVLGGLIIGITGLVVPFLTSSEVGSMQERAGRPKTVSGVTGLWYFPGAFILIGPIIWFVKTNGALNEYWRSQGAAA